MRRMSKNNHTNVVNKLTPKEAKTLLRSIIDKDKGKSREVYDPVLSNKRMKEMLRNVKKSIDIHNSQEISRYKEENQNPMKKYESRKRRQNRNKSLYPKRSKYQITKDTVKRRAIASKINLSGDNISAIEVFFSSNTKNLNLKSKENYPKLAHGNIAQGNKKEKAIEALAKIANQMRNNARSNETEFMVIKNSTNKFASALSIKPAIMDPQFIYSPIKKIVAPTPKEVENKRIFATSEMKQGKIVSKKNGKKVMFISQKKPKMRRRNRNHHNKSNLKISDFQEFLYHPGDISNVNFEQLKEKGSVIHSTRKQKQDELNYFEYMAENLKNMKKFEKSTKSSRFLLGKSKFLKMMNKNMVDNTLKVQKEISDKLLIVKKTKDFVTIGKYNQVRLSNRSNKSLESKRGNIMIPGGNATPSGIKNTSVPIKKNGPKRKMSKKVYNHKRERLLAAKSASEAIRKKVMKRKSHPREKQQQNKKRKRNNKNSDNCDIVRNFKNFNKKFNLFNLIEVYGDEEYLSQRLNYYVGRGNNQKLVGRHIQLRKHVAFSPFFNQSQLVWTQTSKQKNKIAKYSDFKTKQKSQKIGKEDLRDFLRTQMVFKISEDLIKEAVENYSDISEIHCIDAKKLNLFNHIKGMKHIGRKQLMTIHIYDYCQKTGIKLDSIIPKTFLIKTKTSDSDIQTCIEQIKQDSEGFSIPWIVKPGEFSNRGKGIEMAYSEEEIEPKVKKLLENRKGNVVLVQKYLIDPVLFKNRKFDLRCFAFVLKLPKKFSVFWYNEGYARTSSYEYSLGNRDNLMVHLTNEAVQVKSKILIFFIFF